eukprot:2950623-Prymnesium_polylepis.1
MAARDRLHARHSSPAARHAPPLAPTAASLAAAAYPNHTASHAAAYCPNGGVPARHSRGASQPLPR